MSAVFQPVRNDPVEGQPETVYLVDSRANLIIEQGSTRLAFAPAAALELLKFLERTGYQAHAHTLTKGATA